MGVKRNAGGDTVCPFCLMSVDRCNTCLFLLSRKWEKDIANGVTITRALSLTHTVICPKCRKPPRNCWTCRKAKTPCFKAYKAAQDHYPEWFKPAELLPKDREMVENE